MKKFTPAQMKAGLRSLTPAEVVALYNAMKRGRGDEALSTLFSATARQKALEEDLSRAG